MKGLQLAQLAASKLSRRRRRSDQRTDGWMPIETQMARRPEVRQYNY